MVDQNLDQESSDAVHSVENALASLWDKAREASLLISTLREEKKRLLQRIEELEDDVKHAKNETVLQQSQLEKLKFELSTDNAKKNSSLQIDEEEKRHLQQKLKNTIAKLDQYLTS